MEVNVHNICNFSCLLARRTNVSIPSNWLGIENMYISSSELRNTYIYIHIYINIASVKLWHSIAFKLSWIHTVQWYSDELWLIYFIGKEPAQSLLYTLEMFIFGTRAHVSLSTSYSSACSFSPPINKSFPLYMHHRRASSESVWGPPMYQSVHCTGYRSEPCLLLHRCGHPL